MTPIHENDAAIADKDNSRARRSPRPSHSKVANRQIHPDESSPEALAEYERIIAEKKARKAKAKAKRNK